MKRRAVRPSGSLPNERVVTRGSDYSGASAAESEFDRVWPARELLGSGLGDVDEPGPAFEGHFAGGFLEANQTPAVGPAGFADMGRARGRGGVLCGVGVGVGEHRDLVVEAVEEIAGPGQR